jgi:hypothetical protein
MAYAVFIERPDDKAAIPLMQWEVYVDGDRELKWQNEARIITPAGEVLVMPTPHCAIWIGATDETALFCWRTGRVQFERPTDASIAKAKAIAAALRARVRGEADEIY